MNTKDNFSNSKELSKYYVSDSDWDLLSNYGFSTGEPFTDPESWESLLNFARGSWNGSCYGMSLSLVLDKIGNIDVSRRGENVSTINDITSDNITDQIESLINYYQLLFFIRGAGYCQHNELYTTMTQLIEDVKTQGPCLTIFTFDTNDVQGTDDPNYGGHAVVAYKVTEISSQIYKIHIYDPNRLDNSGYFLVVFSDTGLSQCIYREPYGTSSRNKAIYSLGYDTPESIINEFSDFDIDGPYNNDTDFVMESLEANNISMQSNTNNFGVFQTLANDGVNTLYISAHSDFVLSNYEGENLIFDASTMQISGDMDVLENSISFGSSSDSITLILTVPSSGEYNLISDTQNTKIYLLTESSFIGANVTNATKVSLTASGVIPTQGYNVQMIEQFNKSIS